MLYKSKNFILSLVALCFILSSIFFAMALVNHPQNASAQSAISTADYSTPGGNPWGTAFDSTGRVWVALPSCDFAPRCASGTAPGKIALFDPTTINCASAI